MFHRDRTACDVVMIPTSLVIAWLRKTAGIHIRLRHKYSEPEVFGIQPD